MTAAVLAAMCAAVIAGAALQRISGMGLGLVVAPSLTLLVGPAVGVTLSNVVAVVTAVLVLVAMRGDVDWRRWGRLAPLVVVGSCVGAAAVGAFREAWLDVVVGSSVLLAMAASAVLARRRRLDGPGAGVAAGLAAGFMNTTSGVAAPAMTAYALATRWEQRSFAATLQPVYLAANATSLLVKASSGAVPLGALPSGWVCGLVVAAAPVGVVLGRVLAARVPATAARRLAVGVAAAGGALACLRGLLAL